MNNNQPKQGIELPNNAEIKKLWPSIYADIKSEVKEPSDLTLSLEKRVREVLKKHLGTELIKTDHEYKKFFYDAIRFAVNMDTDKILYRIEAGRARYGESRHAKGKIPEVDE